MKAAQVLLLVLALLASTGLSGCTDPDPRPQDVQEGPEPGVVEGRVVGDDDLPIAGVQVSVLMTNHSAQTDEDGGFVMDGVSPGPVVVVAGKQGHSSQTLRGDLSEGGRLDLGFRLVPAPSLEPYQVGLDFEGVLQCGLPQGTSCGPLVEQDSTHHRFGVEPGLRGVVVELAWDPPVEQVAQELRLEFAAATDQACGQSYEAATGAAGLRLRIDDGFPVAGGHQCVLVWPAGDLVVQQAYEARVTLFYHGSVPQE